MSTLLLVAVLVVGVGGSVLQISRAYRHHNKLREDGWRLFGEILVESGWRQSLGFHQMMLRPLQTLSIRGLSWSRLSYACPHEMVGQKVNLSLGILSVAEGRFSRVGTVIVTCPELQIGHPCLIAATSLGQPLFQPLTPIRWSVGAKALLIHFKGYVDPKGAPVRDTIQTLTPLFQELLNLSECGGIIAMGCEGTVIRGPIIDTPETANVVGRRFLAGLSTLFFRVELLASVRLNQNAKP